MKIGQVKDAIASISFLIAAWIVSNKGIEKNVLLAGLLLGFVVDSIFTLNSEWHCTDWEDNSPGKLVIASQVVAFAYLVYINGV